MRRFLNNLLRSFRTTSSATRPAPARKNRARLSLEALETREVPTVGFTPHFSGTGVTVPTGTTLAQEEAPSLKSADVVIIFAGTDWFSNQGFANQQTLLNSIQSILDSPYLSALTQYGSDGKAHLFSEWATTSTPPLSATNGLTPSDSDLYTFVNNQIASINRGPFRGSAPVPSANAIYLVISDPKDSSTQNGTHGYNGYRSNNPAHYAFVGAKGFSGSLLDQFTMCFSHELAESMVPGIQVSDPANLVPADSRQICDGEPETFGNGYGYRLHGGVLVQAYWSQNAGAFIVPDSNSQTVSLSWPSSSFNGTFNLTAYGDQLGANYNDTFTLDRNPVTFGQRLTLNNEVFSFDKGQLNVINLYTEGGANTVTIKSVLPGSSVSVDSLSSTSNDTVYVGNNGSLSDISGPVSVANSSGGKTALYIEAWADPPTDITIKSESVSVGWATINYIPCFTSTLASGVTSVTISDASGTNFIDAQSVPAFVPVTVVGNFFDVLYGPAANQVHLHRIPPHGGGGGTGGGTLGSNL
jgi:hypothetical protein